MFQIDINGKTKSITSERDMVALVYRIPLRHGQYSSLEALKKNLAEATDMLCTFLADARQLRVKEGQKGSELGKLTRLISKLKEYKEFIVHSKNKDALIVSLYNTILSYEGTGLLNGFGMSNRHGDKLKGNPEVQTIYQQ
jgi:hypothetical protein